MKRKAEVFLTEWARLPGRKPLVLRGARQVGKTYLVEHWGKEHFRRVLTVDLERERDLHPLFAEPDPRKLLEELALLKGQSVKPGETLLFLDEIQACSRALAGLRYFHELMPDLHVIAAGSLLDFALREFAHSMPVGRIEYLHLHPLSFEEFVEALEGPALVEYLARIKVTEPLSEAMEKRFLELLRRYFFIGGMPEAVRVYAERQDLLEVQRVQASLVATVQDDFAKYGPRRLQELMRKTYRYAAENVGRKVKFVNVSREDRSGEVRRALELLARSRVVQAVYRTAANGLPLGAERDERHFKVLFLDVGLVNRLCGLDLVGVEDLITVNEGAMAEQYVGQELRAMGLPFEEPPLFYWAREAKNASAEVDYVISRHRDILPVEVKAGRTGTLRSVFQFLREKGRRRAIRFHLRPPALEEVRLPGPDKTIVQLLSLPLYMTGQLDRSVQEVFS
ncbi:ATP-binding protein [bacterium]|nr:ATP-binding protein [bacterium]